MYNQHRQLDRRPSLFPPSEQTRDQPAEDPSSEQVVRTEKGKGNTVERAPGLEGRVIAACI